MANPIKNISIQSNYYDIEDHRIDSFEEVSEISIDTTPTSGSSNLVTSGGVYTMISNINKFDVVVADSLPEASANTMYKIYLIPSSSSETGNVKDEYITIDNGASASPRYTWEKIGSTAIDISGKEDVSNKVTYMNASSTDIQYPSAKAVYDALGAKEDLSNRVTYINNTSTDAQYPTAKAVYDAIPETVVAQTVETSEVSTLGIDDTPTTGSDNLVTSGGVKQYVDNALGTIEATLQSIRGVN